LSGEGGAGGGSSSFGTAASADDVGARVHGTGATLPDDEDEDEEEVGPLPSFQRQPACVWQ
jgi:hypothetical protein